LKIGWKFSYGIDNKVEYSIDWFEDYTYRKLTLEGLNEKSTELYKIVFQHLKAIYHPEYSIRNIKRDVIDRLKEHLLNMGRKPGAINTYLRTLRAAFEKLIIEEILDKNPLYKFKPIPDLENKRKHLNFSELMEFLKFAKENASEDMYHIIRIFVGNGRRRNEILFLERGDVDLEKGLYRPRNEKRKNKDKMSRSIPDDIIGSFEHFMNKYPDAQYPFRFAHESTITHRVKKILIQAGHPELHLHSLRHTNITILSEQGYNLRQIQNYWT
jgi:integrase